MITIHNSDTSLFILQVPIYSKKISKTEGFHLQDMYRKYMHHKEKAKQVLIFATTKFLKLR